jgi:hypothetical protein
MKTDMCQTQSLLLCTEDITNINNEMYFAEKLLPNVLL